MEKFIKHLEETLEIKVNDNLALDSISLLMVSSMINKNYDVTITFNETETAKDLFKKVIEQIVYKHIGNYTDDITGDLLGQNRVVDSMGLVNIIVDLEKEFDITLTSDNTLSFRNAQSLKNKIYEILNNRN